MRWNAHAAADSRMQVRGTGAKGRGGVSVREGGAMAVLYTDRAVPTLLPRISSQHVVPVQRTGAGANGGLHLAL